MAFRKENDAQTEQQEPTKENVSPYFYGDESEEVKQQEVINPYHCGDNANASQKHRSDNDSDSEVELEVKAPSTSHISFLLNQKPEVAQVREKMAQYAARVVLNENGFVFIKELRKGGMSGGSIDLYKYIGQDADIQALLAKDGTLLIKTPTVKDEYYEPVALDKNKIIHAKKTFDLEWKNIEEGGATSLPPTPERPSLPSHMAGQYPSLVSRTARPGRPMAPSLSNHNKFETLYRPRLLAKKYGEYKFILNECIYMDFNKKEAKDLSTYLVEMATKDELYSAQDKTAKIKEMEDKFDSFFFSTMIAQDQLHKHGFYHLDTATRNLCVLPDETLKLIDFGASLPMKRRSESQELKAPYEFLPLQSFDKDGICSSTGTSAISIKTDLFARRITMMDMLAQYMYGKSETPYEVYFKGLPNYTPDCNLLTFLKDLDDNTRLQQMFNNLMSKVETLRNAGDIRGDIVLKQLTKYQHYLTTMPNLKTIASDNLENYLKAIRDLELSSFRSQLPTQPAAEVTATLQLSSTLGHSAF